MTKQMLGAILIGALSVAVAACGGGGGGTKHAFVPSNEVISCLENAGASAELLPSEPGEEMVGGQTPDGDLIFIINLPDSNSLAGATRGLKEAQRESGHEGHLTLTTLNDGSTLIGVLGIIGSNAGVPSPIDQALAKSCATPGPESRTKAY